MTENDKDAILKLLANGSTLRDVYVKFHHIPANEIMNVAFPHTGEIMSPEDRLLKAIFGDI